jgi:hypothetical protein
MALAALTPSPARLPQHRGYISVTENRRYFQDESGQGFVVIGHNDAVTWNGLVELLEHGTVDTTEAYIKDLRAHGVTVSRVMIEYAQFESGFFEDTLGQFRPQLIRFWDEFIALAEKHGLYLLLTPYDTFWQVHNWDRYPYSTICPTWRDWLTHPECVQAQKARWDFVIRRWGGSPNIFAWDLMNEIDLHWGCTPAEIDSYITEIAAYVCGLEMHLYGKTHLLTASSSTAVPNGPLGHIIYNHPMLDFANTHLYVGQGIRAPLDAIECAEEMASGVQLSLQSIYQTRPYFDSESGPIDTWINDLALDTCYHRHMSWAHLAAGGAGSGMRWPYTTPHNLLPEFQDNLCGLAHFAAGVDWVNFNSRNISANIRVSRPGVFKTGCSDGKHAAILWLLADSRLTDPAGLNGLAVTIAYIMRDGLYSVEIWDTTAGMVIDRLPVRVEQGHFSFTLPEFDTPPADLALLIRRVS